MAHQLIGLVLHAVADAVAAIAEARSAAHDGFDLEALRERLQPVPGVELVVPDGAVVTGLIVVVENRPVLMLCARRDPPARRWARPGPAPWSPSGPSSLSPWDDEFNS